MQPQNNEAFLVLVRSIKHRIEEHVKDYVRQHEMTDFLPLFAYYAEAKRGESKEAAITAGFASYGLTVAIEKILTERTPKPNVVQQRDALLNACKITLALLRKHGQTHETCQNNDLDQETYLDIFDTGQSSPLSRVLESAIEATEASD